MPSRSEQAQTAGDSDFPAPQLVTPLASEAVATKPAVPVWKHERLFPGTPNQVREARKFLAAALDGCPAADDAILCISELASNSILYSNSRRPGGTFTVRTEVHDGDYVWIEVEDKGGTWHERPHRDSRPHGLDIVRELSAQCGKDGDELTGWIIWARLDLAGEKIHR